MAKFDFSNAHIGRQMIVGGGDVYFDQRGAAEIFNSVRGDIIHFGADDPKIIRLIDSAILVVNGGPIDDLRDALSDLI